MRTDRWASLAMAALMCTACGGGEENDSAILELSLAFPTSASETITSSVRVWALNADRNQEVTCSGLVGGKASPIDRGVIPLIDAVVIWPPEGPIVLESVGSGSAMVFVQAVSFDGDVHMAGCATTDLTGTAAVDLGTLRTAGTFDCADASTEDGVKCDDGLLCTVGETCRAGQCQGGVQRSCDFLAEECLAATCDEAAGCQPMPVSDGTPCDDGLFCTTGTTCQSGACAGGAPIDCSSFDDFCTQGVCNESFRSCEPTYFPDNDCTAFEHDPECYSTPAPECGQTSSDRGACSGTSSTALSGVSCNAHCFSGAFCQRTYIGGVSTSRYTSSCVGGAVQVDTLDPKYEDTELSCDDLEDNDCDGLTDADDPDCTP